MKMKFKLEELTAEQMDALIKEGYVIETANGDKIPMEEYKKYRRWFNHEISSTLVDVEVLDPLSPQERDYLNKVIAPFKGRVTRIYKQKYTRLQTEGIWVEVSGKDSFRLPRFHEGTQFVGMLCGKGYSLEELGINYPTTKE